MKRPFITLSAGILLSALAFLSSCSRQTVSFAFLDFFLGTVEVLKAGSGIKPVVAKMPLYRDDVVKTGTKSTAFIQWGADTLTRVFENTELRLSILPETLASSGERTLLEVVRGSASFLRLGLAPVSAAEMDSPKADDKKGKIGSAGETKAKVPAAKARLVVTRLAPNGVEPAEAEDISKRVYSALVASKGAAQVLYRAAGDRRSANRALTGRVSKLGQSRIIAVSVVDGEKGSVLYNKTATVRADAELEAQIATIAREIGAQANVWE